MSMSLNDTISTALSGLNADTARLASISSNVANSSTVGYKASETDFESMVLGNGSGGAAPAGVTSVTQNDVTTAGQIQSTGVNTDIAINGAGFLVVNDFSDVGDRRLLSDPGRLLPARRERQSGQRRRILPARSEGRLPAATRSAGGAGGQRPVHGKRLQSLRGGHADHGDDLHSESAVGGYRLQRDTLRRPPPAR